MLPRKALRCAEAAAMQLEAVREHLDADLDRGLTSLETSRRRDIHGFNEVRDLSSLCCATCPKSKMFDYAQVDSLAKLIFN